MQEPSVAWRAPNPPARGGDFMEGLEPSRRKFGGNRLKRSYRFSGASGVSVAASMRLNRRVHRVPCVMINTGRSVYCTFAPTALKAANIQRDSSTETVLSASPCIVQIGMLVTRFATAAYGSGSEAGAIAGYHTPLVVPRRSTIHPHFTTSAANRSGYWNARYQLPFPPAEAPVR